MKLILPIVIAVMLVASALADEPTDKLRVLVVTGGHDFEREPFFGMFDKLLGITYEEAKHGKSATAFERDDLLDFDAVVLFDMMQEITDEQKAAFLKLTQHGVGLVVLHHALVSYQSWPEYERIIGGRYPESADQSEKVTQQGGYRHDVDMPIEIVAFEHPVTRGLQNFAIHDEIYWGFRVAKEVTPLLKTTHPESGNPIAWAHETGNSRVVTIQPGHGPEVYSHPSYRQLVGQSIEWVGKRRREIP